VVVFVLVFIDALAQACAINAPMPVPFAAALAVASLVAFTAPRSADAVIYGGGGGARADCLAVFSADLNDPPSRPRQMRCADGAPCDADGSVNGICQFDVAVCANSTFDPAQCTLVGVDEIVVDHSEDDGDPRFDVDFQALQNRIENQIGFPAEDPDECTTPSAIRVPIAGPFENGACKAAKKIIRVQSESIAFQGKRYRDIDKLKLICDPSPSCSPQAIFTGTFQRIQRQILNASCAVSGCHDSQSQMGGLLLEEGTAHGALVDVVPFNVAAASAGWKRVDGANADPETSFIIHKLRGDLGSGMGERMPFGRPKLPGWLIDVIELWIAAGAPETGWVPGTD
jgi:hypothetical protein